MGKGVSLAVMLLFAAGAAGQVSTVDRADPNQRFGVDDRGYATQWGQPDIRSGAAWQPYQQRPYQQERLSPQQYRDYRDDRDYQVRDEAWDGYTRYPRQRLQAGRVAPQQRGTWRGGAWQSGFGPGDEGWRYRGQEQGWISGYGPNDDAQVQRFDDRRGMNFRTRQPFDRSAFRAGRNRPFGDMRGQSFGDGYDRPFGDRPPPPFQTRQRWRLQDPALHGPTDGYRDSRYEVRTDRPFDRRFERDIDRGMGDMNRGSGQGFDGGGTGGGTGGGAGGGDSGSGAGGSGGAGGGS